MLQRNSGLSASAALTVLMGAAALNPVQAAETYKIVPTQSRVTIYADTTSPVAGLIKRLAHTREMRTSKVSGTVVFSAPNKPQSVSVSVKADSLHVIKKDDLNDDNVVTVDKVTKEKILEAGKYPNVTFKSTKINIKPGAGGAFSGTVMGNFSMHGVTRAVSVPMSGKVSGGTIKAKGSFVVNQSDYGITLLSFMGSMLSVKNPVTIKLDLTAKK